MTNFDFKNEKITAETQKAIDTAMDLVTTSIHSVEKLTHLQLETSRQIMEETSNAIKELATVKDPKEMMARVNAMATQTVEKNIASARDIYDIVNEVQAKMNKITEENVQNLQQAALTSVEGMAKHNPQGAKVATDALNTWISTSNQAIAAMNKVASQVTEFANSNLNSATAATVAAVKKTAKAK